MSIPVPLSRLTEEQKDKIETELQIEIVSKKTFTKFKGFTPPPEYLTPYTLVNNMVYLPLYYAIKNRMCKKTETKRVSGNIYKI